ncbi:antibiotic biosynthesis monooxygenase [Microbulbifer magnicolonia]|uniref:antibiotic biosynthesis monooxygenase n=1 Tax=Microbulbifer magnicolonia TaxID=3109744 RepID=UPI002B406785|nr:antibiotic biosynthesis monooxygenase [Microbulbifer sp. GG15]
MAPCDAREEFIARVQQTHALLRSQPGFIRDILLEKPATGEKFILVTLVEWQDAESVALAREAVAAMHRDTGFSPRDFLTRHGIEAEIGSFSAVDP